MKGIVVNMRINICGVEISMEYSGRHCPPWHDGVYHDTYLVTMTNIENECSFKFYESAFITEQRTKLNTLTSENDPRFFSDLLECINSDMCYSEDSYEDYCETHDYNSDSVKVQKEWLDWQKYIKGIESVIKGTGFSDAIYQYLYENDSYNINSILFPPALENTEVKETPSLQEESDWRKCSHNWIDSGRK